MYMYQHRRHPTVLHRDVLVRTQDASSMALLCAMGISQLQEMQVDRTAAGMPREEHIRFTHPHEVIQLHELVTMATPPRTLLSQIHIMHTTLRIIISNGMKGTSPHAATKCNTTWSKNR